MSHDDDAPGNTDGWVPPPEWFFDKGSRFNQPVATADTARTASRWPLLDDKVMHRAIPQQPTTTYAPRRRRFAEPRMWLAWLRQQWRWRRGKL